MDKSLYFSTKEYAKINSISRIQVIRLIKSGKLNAFRVGRAWLINKDQKNGNQTGLIKTSSLQKWN